MMYTLRFDVETLIIATKSRDTRSVPALRFDVETLIIATNIILLGESSCCGLM